MAYSNVPIFPQSFTNVGTVINNATGVTAVNVRTGSSNGDKIESISITNTDTSGYILNAYLSISAVSYQIGTINVPANAGTDAAVTATVSAIEPTAILPWVRRDSNGRPYLYLGSGNILTLSSQTTVRSPAQLSVVTTLGSF